MKTELLSSDESLSIISRLGKFDTQREKAEKALDKSRKILYINQALRRQQVDKTVNPAEDINDIFIVFVSLRLSMRGFSF